MKSWIEKDKRRRKTTKIFYKKKNVIKLIQKNCNLSSKIRKKAVLLLSTFPKNSSITRIRNRCVLSGRSRSFKRHFRLSRIMLRKMLSLGLIPQFYH